MKLSTWFARRQDGRSRQGLRTRPSVLASAATVTVSLAIVVSVAGWRASTPAETTPDGGSVSFTGPGGSHPVSTTSKSSFSGIMLPDLLVVLPSGLTRAEVKRLRAIKGVRKMITFDGAQITVGGAAASAVPQPGQ